MFDLLNKKNGMFRVRLILLVGAVCVVGLYCASYFEKKLIASNEARLVEEVQVSLSEVARDIQKSLDIYSLELKSMRAFVYNIGPSELSYARFLNYAQESRFEENYPGSRGFGFIKLVEINEETDYLQQIRQDRSDDFQIKYLADNPSSRFVIEYIEPEYKNKQAVGLDIGSEGFRRNAALAAAHHNKVTLTAPITLVQADAKTKHGFLFLYPVYTHGLELGEENSQIFGWVYAPLLIDEMLSAIQQQKTGLNLKISDITSNQEIVFFEGQTNPDSGYLYEHNGSVNLDLFGRVWRINAHPSHSFIKQLSLPSSSELYFQILSAFLFAALLIANVMYLVGRRLQENRQKYELAAVVENGVEGTIGLDESFCFKYWNDAAQNLFGFDDNVFKSPFIAWLEESYSADYLIDLFKRVSKGESVKGLELNVVSEKTQEQKFLHLNFQPIIQKNVFFGANVSMVDLTQLRVLQKQLEEKNRLLSVKINRQDDELKTSTSLHESLLQGADFLIVTTDLHGIITSANRKLEDLLDYTYDDILEHQVVELFQHQCLFQLSSAILENYKHQTKNQFDALVYPLKHQSRIEGEFTFQHKNGSAIELQLTVSAVKNERDEVFGFLFIADDIRDQKALRFDLELVRSAIQNSEDILLWLDESGSICNSNPHSWLALGYSEYELKQLNITDVLSLEVGETWGGVLEELKEGGALTRDEQFVSRKGGLIPCLVTVAKLTINDEHYVYLDAKDISDRLAKEKALEEALNFAAQANLSKDQFLANMGHELRTPLNEVHGSLQLIQLTDLSAEQSEYLSQAKTSVRLLTQSIDDVLDCGEIIRNKLALNFQEVNLLDLLSAVGQSLTVIAEDKNIEVHFDLSEDLPYLIKTDPHRLSQLLMCLMTNAIKFTHEGDVLLKCSLLRVLENEYELLFEVIDSGIGISEEKQKVIFDLFSQVEMQSNRTFGGLGLGLTISKNIVELMSGDIHCQSELGKGTTFSFNIHVGKLDISDPAKVMPDNVPALKVLVVDDNEISLSVLSKLISQLDWSVETATGADNAIECIQRALDAGKGFDLALIDWNMPEKSGLDLVKSIRKQLSATDMPILVMVTAYTRKMLSKLDNRDVENLLSAFLTKPVTRTMLLDLVNSVLDANNKSLSFYKQGRQKLHGFSILLVEDNETNQFIAKNLLQSQGAEVIVASEGEEAWRILNAQTQTFDIVLMDIQMPGWDGYRATQEIRGDERFNDLPILAMTANVLASDKRKCFKVGMNGHIGKPFELIQLVDEIIRLAKKPGMILSHHPKIKSTSHVVTLPLPEKSLSAEEVGTEENGVLNLARNELVVLKKRSNVNISASLQRFAGSEDLYIQSLNMFIHDLDRYVDILTDMSSKLVLEEIKPIFHTLKGTSGLLGFTGLSDLALECEQLASIIVEKGCNAEPLASMIQLMKDTKGLISSIFEDNSQTIDCNSPSLPELDLVLVQELKGQLETSNMKAIETYNKLHECFNKHSVEMAINLRSYIDQLRFKEALTIINQFEEERSESDNG